MHPHEVRSGAVFIEPGLGVCDDFHSPALDTAPPLLIGAIAVLAIGFGEVIVEIEAAIEAGSERVAVENHGSDESCGVVTVLLQQLRRGDMLRRERDAKVGDAVNAGQKASENRDVRSV